MRTNTWIVALLTASLTANVSKGFAPIPSLALKNLATTTRGSRLLFDDCVDCEIPIDLVQHQPLVPMISFDTSKKAAPALNDVSISLLPKDNGEGTKPYPLVIEPRAQASVEFLSSFMENIREWIDEQMLNYGAVLFRGFDVNTA